MDSFSVATTITLADWQAFLRAWARRRQAPRNSRLQIAYIVGYLAVVTVLIGGRHVLHIPLQPGSMVVGVVIGVSALLIRIKMAQRAARPESDSAVLGPRTIEFDSAGLKMQRPGNTWAVSWWKAKEIEITPEHIFVWTDRTSALIVPLRDLPAGMAADEAVARIHAFKDSAATLSSSSDLASDQGGRPPITAVPNPEATQTPGLLSVAARLWTLRRQKAPLKPPADWMIACFAATSFILWLTLDRLRYGLHVEFFSYGVPGLAYWVVAGLSVAWVLSRRTHPRIPFRSALLLLVILAPVAIGTNWAASDALAQQWGTAAELGLVVYALVYLAVGLREVTGTPQVPALAAVTAVAIAFSALNSVVHVSPTLWTQIDPEAQEAARTSWENTEELLIAQPARIDAKLARVRPATGPASSVYFVGFAGVGSQKVFAEEIKLAAQRVGNRYRSSDRTLLLLNDRRDVDAHPLATVSGLRLALKGIALRMNVDRDVLFLALSSHGSSEPELSVSNGMLPLRNLTGAELASILKDSGIKWKVIVISACHAGAFIDALRDDNTIILAAAAADRTSFGCSDDRDLTYFGEALYRDAFAQSASLRDAFKKATLDIAAREQREKIKASNPQAFFGPAMDRKLTEIESATR